MRTHGFTLVEVMVAMCVLALGALGALSTQALAQRGATTARLQARAAALANSLAADIRAGGAADFLGVDYDAASGAPAAPAQRCDAADCTAAAYARDAVYAAQLSLYADFPAGRLLTCRDAKVVEPDHTALAWSCHGAPGAPVAIKLGWAGARHPAVVHVVMAPP